MGRDMFARKEFRIGIEAEAGRRGADPGALHSLEVQELAGRVEGQRGKKAVAVGAGERGKRVFFHDFSGVVGVFVALAYPVVGSGVEVQVGDALYAQQVVYVGVAVDGQQYVLGKAARIACTSEASSTAKGPAKG